MAQQLATLRTPAAYAGVSSYAHAHTAAKQPRLPILRWGMPTLSTGALPRRRRIFSWRARRARSWRTTRTFWPRRPITKPGNEAAAEALLHGFADRYPDSIFDAQAPELEANVLLAMSNAAGAQQVFGAGREHGFGRSRLAISWRRRRWTLALGQTQAGRGGLQEAAAERIR